MTRGQKTIVILPALALHQAVASAPLGTSLQRFTPGIVACSALLELVRFVRYLTRLCIVSPVSGGKYVVQRPRHEWRHGVEAARRRPEGVGACASWCGCGKGAWLC